jgi:hypothetical protein
MIHTHTESVKAIESRVKILTSFWDFPFFDSNLDGQKQERDDISLTLQSMYVNDFFIEEYF